MIAIKEKADKDLVQYNMELKELIRIIDHDRKLKEFMRVKGEERADIVDSDFSQKQKKKETEKDKGDREETVEVHFYTIFLFLKRHETTFERNLYN